MVNRKFKQVNVEVKNKLLMVNGKSADFILPSLINGCGVNCKYCYVYRHNPDLIKVATNVDNILESVSEQIKLLPVKIPNQCGDKWSIDCGCNTDISFYFKQVDWFKVFDTLIDLDTIPTFATKGVNYNLLNYNPKNTCRIRFSFLPQNISNVVMPYSSSNIHKIEAMNYAYKQNWQVHINFSPVILYKGWKQDYKRLFEGLVKNLDKPVLKQLKAEVIFLTHNSKLHNLNIKEEFKHEYLLWQPDLQEEKISQHSKDINVRYKHLLKSQMINEFKDLYSQYFDLKTIRYIF